MTEKESRESLVQQIKQKRQAKQALEQQRSNIERQLSVLDNELRELEVTRTSIARRKPAHTDSDATRFKIWWLQNPFGGGAK